MRGTLSKPALVDCVTAKREPVMVTKIIAVSLKPNQSRAMGTQQALGQALQAEDHAAQRVLQKFIGGKNHSEKNSENHGNGVADHNAPQAHPDADPQTVILESLVQRLRDSLRRGKQIRRPNFCERQRFPNREHAGGKNQLVNAFLHANTPH